MVLLLLCSIASLRPLTTGKTGSEAQAHPEGCSAMLMGLSFHVFRNRGPLTEPGPQRFRLECQPKVKRWQI